MEVTADKSSPRNQDLIPDRDSPEYKAYYYRRFTEACYEEMKDIQEILPGDPIVALWDQLSEKGRQRLLQYGMQFVTFQRHRDLDVPGRLRMCAVMVILSLANAIKSKPPASLTQHKSPKGNALLRTAILNHHAANKRDSLANLPRRVEE